MNWTGGRLQRHSYKSQKKQFAKARLRAQRRHCQGPSSPGSLIPSQRQQVLGPQQEEKRTGSNRKRERQGDKFKDKGRASQHRQSIEKDPRIPLPSPSPYFQPGPTQGAISQSSKVKSPVQGAQPDESPSSGRYDRYSSRDAESQDLQDLREKLLNKTDWANLSIARPLKMSLFPRSDRHVENAARRRRGRDVYVTTGPQAQGVDSHWRWDRVALIGLQWDDNWSSPNIANSQPLRRTAGNSTHRTQTSNSGPRDHSNERNSPIVGGREMNMATPTIASSSNHSHIGEPWYPPADFSYGQLRDGQFEPTTRTPRRSRLCPYHRSLSGPNDARQHHPVSGRPTREQRPATGRSHGYQSSLRSGSRHSSQDVSEPMLLDNEEIHADFPTNGNDRSSFSGSRPMPYLASRPGIYDLQGFFESSSAALEANRRWWRGGVRERSPIRDIRNAAESQDSASTSRPSLISLNFHTRYPRHRERFPNDDFADPAPVSYAEPNGLIEPSEPDPCPYRYIDLHPLSNSRRVSSSSGSHSREEQTISASFQPQDDSSPRSRHERVEQNQNSEDEPTMNRNHRQHSSVAAESSEPVDLARLEVSPSMFRTNDGVDAATDKDNDDNLWKKFIHDLETDSDSQAVNGYSGLPSPAHVNGSELATANGPAYPSSLTEPEDVDDEAASHAQDMKAMVNHASTNRSDSIGSDMPESESSSQAAVVGNRGDSSAYQNSGSDSDEFVNITSASERVEEVDRNDDDTRSEGQSAESQDTHTAKNHFVWNNQRLVIDDEAVNNFLPRFLEPDRPPSANSLERLPRFPMVNMHAPSWAEQYMNRP
ncbi:hypothetical protein AJ79_09899 [Helicocarpus griseus UAMH5409]|uniref:Uncharacterized protein n=1 Tax=Helicocarpus griseus UAMH5409 TaxID=1447875 RepID=A0A2B7WGE0_9EURO|nr:hypothetical protein AJ79_09899 [Helicocarpus griseus UAMH5409]